LGRKQWISPEIGGGADIPYVSKARWGNTASLFPQRPAEIFLIGGWDGTSQYMDVHLFDCHNHQLTEIKTSGQSPSPRAGHSATVVSDSIIVFGGACCTGGPYTFYNDVFLFKPSSGRWEQLQTQGTPPSPRAQHSATIIGNRTLVVIGGFDGSAILGDVHVLDWENSTWSQVETSGSGPATTDAGLRQDFRVPAAQNTVCLSSINEGEQETPYLVYYGPQGCFLLNPTTWKWVIPHLSDVPPRTCHAAAPLGQHGVIVFGGLVMKEGGRMTQSYDLFTMNLESRFAL